MKRVQWPMYLMFLAARPRNDCAQIGAFIVGNPIRVSIAGLSISKIWARRRTRFYRVSEEKRAARWKHARDGNRISWQVDLPWSKVLGFVGVVSVVVLYARFHALQQCLRENLRHSIAGKWNRDNRTVTRGTPCVIFLFTRSSLLKTTEFRQIVL